VEKKSTAPVYTNYPLQSGDYLNLPFIEKIPRTLRLFGCPCIHFMLEALQGNSMVLLQELGMLYDFILENLEPFSPKLNQQT
jgi:hypothetical protein